VGEDGAEVEGRAAALVGGPAGPESGPSVVSELSGGIVVPITRGSGDGAACSCDKGFARSLWLLLLIARPRILLHGISTTQEGRGVSHTVFSTRVCRLREVYLRAYLRVCC